MAYKQAWDSVDPATRRAWTAIYKMNTEEDVQRAEALLQGLPHPHSQLPGLTKCWRRENPVLRVLLKKRTHEHSTGHRIKS